MKHPWGVTALSFFVLVVAWPCAAAPWITQSAYGKVHVVVADKANATERHAGDEFVKYWNACTGATATVSSTASAGVNVYIGVDTFPKGITARPDLKRLGPDGVWIRTARDPATHAPALLIGGGPRHGVLYSVYEFFKRYIGVRWLTPETTFIPGRPSADAGPPAHPWERRTPSAIPEIHYEYAPVFVYRKTMLPAGGDQKTYYDANHLSEDPGFGLFVHTSYTLLPPEKYFHDHPDYYSEIDGKRIAPVGFNYNDPRAREGHGNELGQLCFSNPAVADAIVKELRARIKANPGPKIWSVSQMDWGNYCQCPRCRAIDEREGTPMGSLLTGVNRVADQIAKEFPGYYIETLAYTWSRTPPKHLRPHKNVIIRLCSIECDFAHPLDDKQSKENAQFARDIRVWSRIAPQLYIWDYTVDFDAYQLPHPNLQVLASNARFFARHKVRGLFEQGVGAPQAAMGYLRPYLLCQVLWNPNVDLNAAENEFISLYFREAGPFIRQYLDLARKTVLAKHWMMNTFDSGGWMDYDFITKARHIFDEARAAAQSAEIRRRVAFAEVSVEYAAIVAPPRITIANNTMTLQRPKCLSYADYIKLAKSFGITQYGENFPITEFGTRPQQIAVTSGSSPIVTLENKNYLVWITPNLEGSVVRWRDKRSGTELLDGFRDYGAKPGTWQDWTNTPFKAEGPVAATYRVVARSKDSVTLEATRYDGLVVRRTMTLRPGSDRLEVKLTASNPTSKPLAPNVKIHPEFYSQKAAVPEIWGCYHGHWKRLKGSSEVPPVADGKYLKAEGYSGLAFRAPGTRLNVGCSFDAAQLGGLLWFYNSASNAEQVNLELLPKNAPLPPGGSRSISGSYYVSRKAL